jgi:CRISPR-associated protein Cas1
MEVLRAIIKAKLEPYLGFLHSEQFGKPSLVCDLMELYRYLIDDFLIQYSQNLKKERFYNEERRLLPQKKRTKRVSEESLSKRLHEQTKLLL